MLMSVFYTIQFKFDCKGINCNKILKLDTFLWFLFFHKLQWFLRRNGLNWPLCFEFPLWVSLQELGSFGVYFFIVVVVGSLVTITLLLPKVIPQISFHSDVKKKKKKVMWLKLWADRRLYSFSHIFWETNIKTTTQTFFIVDFKLFTQIVCAIKDYAAFMS